jgi:hypothetical protein
MDSIDVRIHARVAWMNIIEILFAVEARSYLPYSHPQKM